MKGIQIKINGTWIYLEEDFSISLEQSSPIFNDQGTFSFPFEIPLGPNRELFKNIADPFGGINLKDIDRMESEIWIDGVMLYHGVIETDEEVEFDEGTLPVTFISGNSDFMDRINGINCQDIPLDREIKLGYVVETAGANNAPGGYREFGLPDYIMMNFTEFNVTDPYPLKTFCNARICTSNENGYYKVLEAKRPFSGVCFYVRYLLDCIFKYLEITVSRNDIGSMEDMNRLAFFSTQCHTEPKGEERSISLSEIRSKDFCGPDFTLKFHYDKTNRNEEVNIDTEGFTFKGRDVYATNENFPNVEVEEVFDDLKNAFGVRFVYDSARNEMDIIYVKDVLTQQTETILDVDILSCVTSKSKNNTLKLTYSVDDDTSYNYDDYSNVKIYNSYDEILAEGIKFYDSTCKIDSKTGNAYRVKVNKDTGKNQSLFEVGGFRDYIQGDSTNEDEIEEISINFKPVINNMVKVEQNSDGTINAGSGYTDIDRRMEDALSVTRETSSRQSGQEIATFVDVELLSEGMQDGNIQEWHLDGGRVGSDNSGPIYSYLYMKSLSPEQFDKEESEESPLRSYDAGYTMGIMRGPGNESGVEIQVENYDGEGNGLWMQTVKNYSFTADTCDNYGSFFDYNGTEQGGADQSGRFALKFVAGKDGYPISQEYQGRGLVSKFLSQYLYFMANKKTIILTVRMTISQIANIDMLKRYKIGDYVGFINKLSYTVDRGGISEVTIELYTI